MSLPPRDQTMVTALGEFFVHEFEQPLLKRIAQLEQRISELEKRGVEYVGAQGWTHLRPP